ncbi:hypothetical protein HYS90_02190 [Candidatus Curtissbacteria bacterium]|nr:hypothetical protein [Candidatus Curtissbacteria bacterium]
MIESAVVSENGRARELGVLTILSMRAGDYVPPRVREVLDLKEEDWCLVMHLEDKVKRNTKREILLAFRDSFRQVASYLQECRLVPRYILGITHERLVHAAGLFGFKSLVVDPSELPKDEIDRINNGYKLTASYQKEKPIGDYLVCYQPLEGFIRRFAGEPQSQSAILG